MTASLNRHFGSRAGIHRKDTRETNPGQALNRFRTYAARSDRNDWIFRGRQFTSNIYVTITLIALIAISIPVTATNFDYKGNIKYRSLLTSYPADSLFQDYIDDPAWDNNANLRLNLSARKNAWALQADYELVTIHGDSVSFAQQNPGLGFTPRLVPDDDHRLMDLTHIISQDANSVTAHHLDRLHLDYSTDQLFFRIGRQAVSWGNGLIYNPMDFFNPFDPAAVDKEYKTGDDMLYAQYLFDSSNDLQAVWVGRRDDNGDVSSTVSSSAVKYHLFVEDYEFDLLVAEHFDSPTLGLGGVANVGGSIWRSDIVVTDTDSDTYLSALINFSYSWVALDKNVSAAVELYRNGFGIDDGDYSPTALANNPQLVQRLQRGELYTVGKHYLAATATIELSPLWLFTPNIFANLDDHSVMLQLLSQHDVQQDLQLLLALNLPFGSDGSEFGGIDSGVPGRPLSVDASAFMQLGWYF